MERIVISGRYDKSVFDVFDILSLGRDNYQRFEPLFIGSGGSTNLNSAFCSFLNDKKPAHCAANPDAAVFVVNGCSVPDNMPSFIHTWAGHFNSACNNHDSCYIYPGSNRSVCDTNFHDEMQFVCLEKFESSNDWKLKYSCKTNANIFYTGVRAGGGNFFEVAQDNVKCDAWHELKDKYCS